MLFGKIVLPSIKNGRFGMKILVFSDSHGITEKMSDIIASNSADAELVIHLGDRTADLQGIRERYPQIAFLFVKGNCDFSFLGPSAPEKYSVVLEDRHFFLTHGHLFGVKGGDLRALECEAAKNNYDVVLYGHTHIPSYTEKNGVVYFNPGSISQPRGGSLPSYGIITLSQGKSSFKTVEVEL